MDIGSGKGYPHSKLSNFAPNKFKMDGVKCASMEGFLQSLKFDKPHVEEEVCKMVGRQAKFKGKKRNKAWKSQQTLWWRGVVYPRGSIKYQMLLDRAYKQLYKNRKFKKALLSTRNATLRHSLGANKRKDTVLTKREFCSRLERLRNGDL